jgi:membrane-associated phospholipid phosphatase
VGAPYGGPRRGRLAVAVACATYLLFPVYLERPVLEVGSLATYLLSLEYHDPSYNHFPSLHVAISWLVYLACRDAVRLRGVFLVLVIGISISTVFVKQHYAVDVLAGTLLAWGAWTAAGRWAIRIAPGARPCSPAVVGWRGSPRPRAHSLRRASDKGLRPCSRSAPASRVRDR